MKSETENDCVVRGVPALSDDHPTGGDKAAASAKAQGNGVSAAKKKRKKKMEMSPLKRIEFEAWRTELIAFLLGRNWPPDHALHDVARAAARECLLAKGVRMYAGNVRALPFPSDADGVRDAAWAIGAVETIEVAGADWPGGGLQPVRAMLEYMATRLHWDAKERSRRDAAKRST
jgi:hypothetical protein